MAVDDHIGIVRVRPGLKVEAQRERLQEAGYRRVLELGTRKDCYSRDQLEKVVRNGTTIGAAQIALLADPRYRRQRGGMLADWHRWTERMVRDHKIKLHDLETGTIAATPGQRRAMYALAKLQLAGGSSALNGSKSKGRPRYVPTKAELDAAKLVWLDTRTYPTWEATDEALKKINRDFTRWRAHQLWGARLDGK